MSSVYLLHHFPLHRPWMYRSPSTLSGFSCESRSSSVRPANENSNTMNIAAQLLVLTDKIMNYRGNTALFLPLPRVTVNFLQSPRYYHEIFPIYHGITTQLPLSPLPCHSLLQMLSCMLYSHSLHGITSPLWLFAQ